MYWIIESRRKINVNLTQRRKGAEKKMIASACDSYFATLEQWSLRLLKSRSRGKLAYEIWTTKYLFLWWD
jgi:hypothetical protein